MKILICDDNKATVEHLKKYLDAYSQKHKIEFIISAYTDSRLAFEDKNKFDIAFIDIQMPTVNGLTLTQRLKENNEYIIVFIITSYNRYLDEAMDLEVFRYISKPIDEDRLYRSINLAIKKYNNLTHKIILDYYDECYNIFSNDILYITTEDNKSLIVTKNRQYQTTKRLKIWVEQLRDVKCFAQPHHSYIVNMNYVEQFNKREVLIKYNRDAYRVPVSQRGYSAFKTAYFSFIGI